MTDESLPPEGESSGPAQSPFALDEESVSPPIGAEVPIRNLPIGTTMGRYVILGEVAHSGSGVVYAAFDPELDHKIALKLLPLAGNTPEAQDICAREVLARAGLVVGFEHPNVARVHEITRRGNAIVVAMEFIDGISLQKWMEARDEPFPWPEVLKLFLQAGYGLAAAHAAGIVHGDFKPENVMVGESGRVYVLDFGLALPQPPLEEEEVLALADALPADGGDSHARLSRSVLGTPAYWAPEQHLGTPPDAKTDQFAFCIAFYEALYGERPFQGELRPIVAIETLSNRVRPPPSGSDVPPWLRDALVRGLNLRASERHPSLAGLLQALDRDPIARRRRWMKGSALAAGLTLFVAVTGLMLRAESQACQPTGEELDDVWDDPARERLASVLTSQANSPQTWATIEAGINGWVNEWLRLRARACDLTEIEHQASQAVLEERYSCLDARLEELRAFVQVYATADRAMVERAEDVLESIAAPSNCIAQATQDLYPKAADPIPELRNLEQQASIALRGGNVELARSRAEEVRTRLDGVEYPSLQSDNLRLLGELAFLGGDLELAEDREHQAIAAADAAGLPLLAAEGWLTLAGMAIESGHDRASDRWLTHASATIESVPDRRLEARLAEARGNAAARAGRVSDALSHYHRALDVFEKNPEATTLARAKVALELGKLASAQGDRVAARTYLRTGIAWLTERLGPRHPRLAEPLHELAEIEAALGFDDDAMSSASRAMAIESAARGSETELAATIEVSLAGIDLRRDQPGAAADRFTRAIGTLRSLGIRDEELRKALQGFGRACVKLGRRGEARNAFEEALRLQGDGLTVAQTQELLAAVLWHDEPEMRQRAIALAHEARDGYAAAEAGEDLARVDDWLAEHVPESL